MDNTEPLQDDHHCSSTDLNEASSFSAMSPKKHEDYKPMQTNVENLRVDESHDASDDGVGNEPPSVQENEEIISPCEATTPDSGRSCGLQTLMGQLQTSGLVLKTSGPDGEIVWHLEVLDGKLEEPVSGHIKSGLFEADVYSVWSDALEERNCKLLMQELKENPGLLLQRGPQGMTVLHAAVMRGCTKLLKQVRDLFDGETGEFVDVQLGRKCSQRQLLNAKYGDSKSTTYDLVTLYFGVDRRIMSNIDDVISEISSAVRNETSKREKLSVVIKEVSRSREFVHLKRSFIQDCDYNFVSDQKELCFHYACQEFHRNIVARDYVRKVVKLCKDRDYPLEYLFKLKNAQGRTPLHAWANASWWRVPDPEIFFLQEIPGYTSERCLIVNDAKGWTILHMAAAGGFDNLLRYILNDGRINANTRTKNKEASTALHLAILHNKRGCAELLSNIPISGNIESGFIEADAHSNWYQALEKGDCRFLMRELAKNNGLLLQTGPKGMNVLHAGVMKGCIPLLQQVLDLVDEGEVPANQSGRTNRKIDLHSAEYGNFKTDVFDTCDVYFGINKDEMKDIKSVISAISSKVENEENVDLKEKLLNIINKVREHGVELRVSFSLNPNYYFVRERRELLFHYACQEYHSEETIGQSARKYVRQVIRLWSELHLQSADVLRYLFMLKNAQGQTPFHAWAQGSMSVPFRQLEAQGFLEIAGADLTDYINTYDAKGWTILHSLAAGNEDCIDLLKYVLEYGRADGQKKTKDGNCTALHLAILHYNDKYVELLLEKSNADINTVLERNITCGYGITYDDKEAKSFLCWTPLQLAALMGRSNVVRLLLKKIEKIHNGGICKINLTRTVEVNNLMLQSLNSIASEPSPIIDEIPDGGKCERNKISPLLLAAASGDSETLRLFLYNLHDYHHFDPLLTYKGATALHFAVDATLYKLNQDFVHRFLFRRDFVNIYDLELNCHPDQDIQHMNKENTTTYNGRRECIIMLLQSGLDVWQKNDKGRFPEPGPLAPQDARRWWQEQIAKETQDARRSLNEASNAIAVVAALVATASFVGPLQPPLGYGTTSPDLDLIQASNSCIRVFVISNSLSFYFAIASIMFAVVPYLPMPQESLYDEWKRIRSTVSKAVFLLLMSVICVLISFGAASNVGMSEEYSWQHKGLAFYSALLSGFLCLCGVFLLFLRSLILIHPKNKTMKHIYRCVHYRRRCKIRAPCCSEIFDCRHCHNDAKNINEKDETKRHEVDCRSVEKVICSLCKHEQNVHQVCENCGVCMSEYFCSKCKFFDDDTSKQQYHCDQRGICNPGGRDNYFHCNRCGCCYSVQLREGHTCVEKSTHQDCPV